MQTWRELDHRWAGNLSIGLYWNTQTDQLKVNVWEDRNSLPSVSFNPPPEKAKDAFEHPFAYLVR